MYQYRPAYRYKVRYPHLIRLHPRLTPKEKRWRRKWPYVITLILATFMLLLTIIIFALEIASLSIDSSNTLSNTASTGAGIWCSISFFIAIAFMYLLVFIYNCSHLWATFTLATHSIAFIFICILIGLDANAVTPYNTMISTAPTKIQVLKAQLAMSILMLVFPILFLTIYIYTAFVILLPRRRAHPNLVYPPAPYPARLVKY
ncbi:unnamed protein product [Adineta steineri]|uniref:Uncharacterized protein n=1 Tax=Adineta steineri TaxID=433720 RepID=A0A819CXL0_9BILA|nr:unnamed protein product [Adineta steineri]CAF3823603.1 unnamed protein product [Adineta steineri]